MARGIYTACQHAGGAGHAPRAVLCTATAEALSDGGQIGLLASGAKADLKLLDFNAAHIQPAGDGLASLGRHRWPAHHARQKFVDFDEFGLLDECRDRAKHVAKRAGMVA